MVERRSLVQGLKVISDLPREAEAKFVYGEKPTSPSAPSELSSVTKVKQINRVPFTTRIRSDLANAVKRVSLERRLQEVGSRTKSKRYWKTRSNTGFVQTAT